MSSGISLLFGQKFLLGEYLTVRFGLSLGFSFLTMILIMPRGIRFLKSLQGEGQPIRNDGPATHAAKKGTPTMGGIFMVFSILLSSLLFANLSDFKVLLTLLTMVLFCGIGFFDDFAKLSRKSAVGIRGKKKFLLEIIISGGIVFIGHTINAEQVNTNLYLPIFKDVVINLGILYFIFAAFVMTGSSNAVNLTDGLDGLVSVPLFLAAFTMGIIAYFAGDVVYAKYLHIQYIKNAGELIVICGAMMGACLGFLWFNAKPASIFMGDTGSLSMGACIGIISVFTKHEILLLFAGGLFVLEALSVILQVGSYKLRNKKRIFLMAPLHHHFEKKGLSEEKVVVRFWIVAFIFTIIALGMMKIK